MVNKYYKKTKKSFKKHRKGIKIFLRRKRKKVKKGSGQI